MKIGTFKCWLFGHKFYGPWHKNPTYGEISTSYLVCARCYILKEAVAESKAKEQAK